MISARGRTVNIGGSRFITCRLTEAGNQALQVLCHTAEQREVWNFPASSFLVRLVNRGPTQVLAVSTEQVETARPGYVNALLIASGKTLRFTAPSSGPGRPLGPLVRLPTLRLPFLPPPLSMTRMEMRLF